MTPKQLRELAEKATPGPWLFGERHGGRQIGVYFKPGPSQTPECICYHHMKKAPWRRPNRIKNMSYITAANPETILKLLDERDELRLAVKTALKIVTGKQL